MHKEVIIIGGGIVGLCTAYYLVKEGHRVTVIDKSGMAAGASYVNAGYITPSHIIPLAAPGTISKGLMWMFNASSPFYMKPRFDMDFFKWAWYFKKSSTNARVQKAIPLLKDLNVLSRTLYKDMLRSEDLGMFHFEHKGVLAVYNTDKAAEKALKIYELAKKEGLEAEVMDIAALKSMEPYIHRRVKGAIHYRCDAHSTPNQIMERLKKYLAGCGVPVKRHEEVLDLKKSGGRITHVITNTATYTPDEVIVTAGSWSGLLVRNIGLKLPLQAGKGYRIDVEQPTHIRMPAILSEAKVAVTPMDGFTRFAGTMEFSGINTKIRKKRVLAIAHAASNYYEPLEIARTFIDAAQCGLRPVSPDGLPYIGRTSKAKNLIVATGHAMMGWSLGPVTGKLVSEIVSDKKTTLAITAYHPERRF